MPDEPLRVQLAGEDSAHEVLLQHLSDAIIGSAYIDPTSLGQMRVFLDAVNNGKREGYFSTRDATERLRGLLNMPRGRPYYRSPLLDGRPVGSAAEIVDTVACIYREQDNVQAILLLVDEDGSARRAAEVARAQAHFDGEAGAEVLLGVCVPTAEGWLVSLIGEGHPRCAALKRQLSFDPVQQPHRLNTDKKSPRHAKRVLHALLASEETPLMELPSSTPRAEETDAALSGLRLDPAPERWPSEGGLRDFLRLLQERYRPMVEERP